MDVAMPPVLRENPRHRLLDLRRGVTMRRTQREAAAASSVLAPFVAMPFVPSSFLLLVVRPGAPSSFLLLVRMLLVEMPLLLVAMPGAPSSVSPQH